MIHRAIEKCGRPIVLSLSPGPAMVEQAEHLRKYANLWRITNDFWDCWENIMEMFDRCNNWAPYVSEGCFPDCDMLPIGHISIRGCEHGLSDRWTRLSKAEQRTMLTLWNIFRSPLMIGCELTDMDEWTKSLLTNEEVLALLKKSRNAHQAVRQGDMIVWQADDEEGNAYLAVFNTTNWSETFAVDFRALDLSGSYKLRDLWEKKELGEVEGKLIVGVDSHDAKLYKLSK